MTHHVQHSGVVTIAPEWRKEFEALPRRMFLPNLIWPLDHGGYPAVHRRTDPQEWERWAAADVAIVTQWDDGAHTGRDPGRVPTSSASTPSIVAAMLHDLEVEPWHRVLDVGAGTGWTTGLLATRVGAENVIGVEVDPNVAQAAGERLRAVGLPALVVAANGDDGWPGGAPYDRIQGTFAVRGIPAAWVEQTRPGGLIVVPWGTRYSNVNAIARLTVAGDGTASGRFTRLAEFMLDRQQRGTWPDHEEYLPGGEWPDDRRESQTTLTAEELAGAEFVIGLQVPDIVHAVSEEDDGSAAVWLYGLTDRSWAAVSWCTDGCTEFDVFEGGLRDLWREVETAYRWWTGAGQPDETRFGLTVSPEGQRVWLDFPERVVSRLAR
jgi:protein-L-isoaspartate O-methyltransferase